MTTAEIVPADAGAARERVDRIKTGVNVIWQLVVESFKARDWQALGYSSWDDMCTREFGTSHLRLPREERAETVQSLREAGLSLRAIASATGDSYGTTRRALAGEPNGSPADPTPKVDQSTGEVLDDAPLTQEQCEALDTSPSATPPAPPVTGTDGKTYPSSRPKAEPKPEDPPPPGYTADSPAKIAAQARAEFKNSPWAVFQAKLAEAGQLTDWLRLDEIGGPAGVTASLRKMSIPGDTASSAEMVVASIGRLERTLTALRAEFNELASSRLRSVR